MKRECLLSRSYTGPPMMLAGVELAYAPIVNEILREFQTAFFNGDGPGDQTHHGGMCEGILIMYHIARDDKAEIHRLRQLPRAARHAAVLDFFLDHEAEITALQPAIIARMESAAAAAVESEAAGKSPLPPRVSSPP